MNRLRLSLAAILLLAACGAQSLKVEPVKVEPIHVTVDVNLHEAPATPASAPKR